MYYYYYYIADVLWVFGNLLINFSPPRTASAAGAHVCHVASVSALCTSTCSFLCLANNGVRRPDAYITREPKEMSENAAPALVAVIVTHGVGESSLFPGIPNNKTGLSSRATSSPETV